MVPCAPLSLEGALIAVFNLSLFYEYETILLTPLLALPRSTKLLGDEMTEVVKPTVNVNTEDLLGIPEVDNIIMKYSPWPGETVERDL
ncbi:hypothetical protein IPA_08875 [Ignicoccus pacificus DSM 13166]|uniref:Uncharacterized protein n=1 Tax=Ignicoccus pacificus DSM 13166 TaxID=940294 RepID=A0A977PLC5_9CREN|nr:hypothetical protein IPA_08875 [Ignicoccus pacificus DSM 13166]